MAYARRIFLFIALNFLVVLMISIVLNLLGIRPYLNAYGINYTSLLIFCLIWGFGGAFISLALSRVMAKWTMRVQLIDPKTEKTEEKQLLQTVKHLVKKAHLPAMPQVGIYASPEVNAFATGPSRKRALVAVSSGLLHRMNAEEVESILGHEIAHVANGDMVTMTLLQGVVNAFVMFLARVLAFVFSGMGRNREQGGITTSYILFMYLFEVIFMILGTIVIATYSRRREFRADAGGAKFTSKEGMISALQSLQKLSKIQSPVEQPAMNAYKISHPGKGGLMRLFATHPPIEERIARLQNE